MSQYRENVDTKILEKLNMVLNNLESKLLKNEKLCIRVATLIDMLVECRELVKELNSIDTNIPILKQRISETIKGCNESVREEIIRTMESIKQKLAEEGAEMSEEYIIKIKNTIESCVNEYETYTHSRYYIKYSSKHNHNYDQNTQVLIKDILFLY